MNRYIPFASGTAVCGVPGTGWQWMVTVSVPSAVSSQTFTVLVNGVAQTTLTGSQVYGPIALEGQELLTVTGATVYAGQSVLVAGEVRFVGVGEANPPPNVYNVMDYGADPSGTNDSTSAINNAISTAQAAGGGVVFFPAGTYLVLGAITFVYTGPSTAPVQAPVRLMGTTGVANGYWAVPTRQGSVLNLQYDGSGTAVAKIDTRGAGLLEVDHLTLYSGSTDNYLFFQTTNTTVRVHDNTIIGNQANSGTSCAQDFLTLGGQSTTVSDGSTAPFQGYGSKVWNNFYSNIRHGINWGTFANGVVVEDETYSKTCGSSETEGAPYTFSPASGQGASGNRISGTLVEMLNYPYAVALLTTSGSQANVFDSLSLFDDGTGSLAAVYAASGCSYNTLIMGICNLAALAGSGTDNLVLDGRSGHYSTFPQGLYAPGPVYADNLNGYSASYVTTESLKINNASQVSSGSGAPAIAGALGDLFFRTDTPSTANQRIYICTTAGAAGSAVWTGIV